MNQGSERMNEVPHDPGAWLSAARAGSLEALGQALEGCRRYLLHIARNQLKPDLQVKGGASDLVQETFLEAHRVFPRFQGNSDVELRAWLRQLLLHRAAKLGRRYRTTQKRRLSRESALEPANPSLPSVPSPSGQAIAHEQEQSLENALERLPEDYRQVIKLRYQEGKSFEEISRLMQRTPNAVRLLWLRAVERVKLELGRPHVPG
jgi:RNA polymerase sigma-70 factor (ECF subfamily)